MKFSPCSYFCTFYTLLIYTFAIVTTKHISRLRDFYHCPLLQLHMCRIVVGFFVAILTICILHFCISMRDVIHVFLNFYSHKNRLMFSGKWELCTLGKWQWVLYEFCIYMSGWNGRVDILFVVAGIMTWLDGGMCACKVRTAMPYNWIDFDRIWFEKEK